jgi:iron complex outermembrane receptor protein
MKTTLDSHILRTVAPALRLAVFALVAAPYNPLSGADAQAPVEDTVELSPFEVRATDGSYTSSVTSSGTRIRVDIRELPFSVGVVTGDFIKDFFAFNDYKDSLAYTSGVSTRGNYNQAYYIRGLQNDGQLRNGFFRAGMFDSVNVDRIEVIKGPNAAIYGRSSPGGAINVVTKTPKPYLEAGTNVRVGANDFHRFELNVTGPLAGRKLRFRVDAASQREQFYYDNENFAQDTVSGVLQYVWDSGSTLTFEADWLDKFQQTLEARTLFRRVGGVITSELAEELGGFNPTSPQAYLNRKLKAANLTFEHRFGDKVRLRATAHASERLDPSLRNGGQTYYTVETRTVGGRRTELRDGGTEYYAFQSDLLAEFAVGATEHKLLATYDYARDEGSDIRWRVFGNQVNNPAFNVPTLSIDNPNYFMIEDKSLMEFYQNATDTGVSHAVFVSDRIYFADKRGLLLLGARQNWVKQSGENLLNNTSSDTERREAFTYQLGLNWKLSEPVSAYVNYSTSFRLNGGLDPNGNPWDNQEGKGGEAGLKAELLDKKLSFTAAYFDITRSNVLRTNPVTTLQELTGEENSKGFELEFHYQATPNWVIFGQYTNLRAEITADVQDPTLVGFQLPFVPDVTYGLATRYEVGGGKMKGLFFTMGYKFVDEITTSTSSAAYQRNYRQDSYTQLDGSVGYGWTSGDRLRHQMTMNIKNLLDEDYYFGDRVRGHGLSVYASYSLTFR